MPSTTPLTDAINALTTYANTVTGKTPPDTTLSDAVATLASGYGGGGGSFETGTIAGDGVSSSSFTQIPVNHLYSHFIIYLEDVRATHANGDLVCCGGTVASYFGVAFTNTGISAQASGNYNATSYLVFSESVIKIKFVCNGGYKPLQNGGSYRWIAW